jgi:hypothetical protein
MELRTAMGSLAVADGEVVLRRLSSDPVRIPLTSIDHVQVHVSDSVFDPNYIRFHLKGAHDDAALSEDPNLLAFSGHDHEAVIQAASDLATRLSPPSPVRQTTGSPSEARPGAPSSTPAPIVEDNEVPAVVGLVLLIVCLAVVGIGIYYAARGIGNWADSQPDQATEQQSVVDATSEDPVQKDGDGPAQFACSHYQNVSEEAAAGLLTDDEIRSKIREVYDTAKLSETPGIADSAERMLQAVTAMDAEALTRASEDFTSVCESRVP